MDIRRQGFFGYLTLNGKSVLMLNDMCAKGSTMSIVAEALKSLVNEKSRLDHEGKLEIVLRIRNVPVDSGDILTLGRSEEVAALLEGGSDSELPTKDESYEQFYQRLLDSDYPQVSAEFIAAQWFGREVNPATSSWLNDPKAVRFRVLNSRDEEFEAALPSEYESLKNYVKTTYPEFVKDLTFRTA